MPNTIADKLQVILQYPLPQQLLTRIVGWFAASKTHWLKQTMINGFFRIYKVVMQEAVRTNASDYINFNDFFTRELNPDTRPLPGSPREWVSPCDGAISAVGNIQKNTLIQAKGVDYPLHRLLGSSSNETQSFEQGSFATIYLSPSNYHRIHMPCNGRLEQCTYIPGRLFSVSPATTRALPNLFCRNERLICHFLDDANRPFIMALVGAMIVGGIATTWHGPFLRQAKKSIIDVPTPALQFKQGEEMGRFFLGSTVILVSQQANLWRTTVTGQSIQLKAAL